MLPHEFKAPDGTLIFPRLHPARYELTSPDTARYNCIAWAAHDTQNWWWPFPYGGYWPAGLERKLTMACFVEAYATLGYQPCPSNEPESGYEKVALFSDAGKPTHAARQLPDGRWTSKLGKAHDIAHQLHDVEGPVYGQVEVILRRPRPGGAAS